MPLSHKPEALDLTVPYHIIVTPKPAGARRIAGITAYLTDPAPPGSGDRHFEARSRKSRAIAWLSSDTVHRSKTVRLSSVILPDGYL